MVSRRGWDLHIVAVHVHVLRSSVPGGRFAIVHINGLSASDGVVAIIYSGPSAGQVVEILGVSSASGVRSARLVEVKRDAGAVVGSTHIGRWRDRSTHGLSTRRHTRESGCSCVVHVDGLGVRVGVLTVIGCSPHASNYVLIGAASWGGGIRDGVIDGSGATRNSGSQCGLGRNAVALHMDIRRRINELGSKVIRHGNRSSPGGAETTRVNSAPCVHERVAVRAVAVDTIRVVGHRVTVRRGWAFTVIGHMNRGVIRSLVAPLSDVSRKRVQHRRSDILDDDGLVLRVRVATAVSEGVGADKGVVICASARNNVVL